MPIALNFDTINALKKIDDYADRLAAAALMYANAGYYVVPLRKNGKILPPRDTGIDYRAASKDPMVVSAWFGEGGPWRGCNIGLAAGAKDSIFVIDVDIHQNGKGGENNGYDTLQAMFPDDGIDALQAPYQETPNGGRHYIYRWCPNGSSSSNKVGKGLDTRGGDGVNNKSHIVVWPSIVDDGAYEWKAVGDLPDIPDFVSQALGEVWDAGQKEGGRGNENVGDEDMERIYTIREIAAMLKAIKIDDITYDEWLMVGHAIYTQHPDANGLHLWHRWSATGSRHEPGECHKRWGGFTNGAIRMGSLIRLAMLHGHVPQPNVIEIKKDDEPTEFQEMIEEFNKDWALVVAGGKIRVIGTKLNDDPDEDLTLMGIDDFKTLTMNQKIISTDARGQPRVVFKSAVWLGAENRREYIGGITFRPDWDGDRNGCYNLWQGWRVLPRPGDWSKMKWHILNIVCNGNESHYTWILDWMAQMYQDPANPPGTALVLKGVEGAGKGIFIEAMGRTIGRHYKHLTQSEHIVGRFNGHMNDALLVFADEVVYGGDKRTAGVLKALVTERKLTLERKGVDATSYRNCARVAMASNEDWFIPAGPQSRRWFVLEASPQKAGDEGYFDALIKEMENGGIEAMMYELKSRKLTCNLRVAPETKALRGQRASYVSHNSVVQWWADKVERGSIEALDLNCMEIDAKSGWPEVVDRLDLYDVYEQWCLTRNQRTMTKSQFYIKMEEMGLVPSRPTVGGQRRYAYQIPAREEAIAMLRHKGGVDIEL